MANKTGELVPLYQFIQHDLVNSIKKNKNS